jgi:hypothetical protein
MDAVTRGRGAAFVAFLFVGKKVSTQTAKDANKRKFRCRQARINKDKRR